MSILKNTFRLNRVYDLISAGCWTLYNDGQNDQSAGSLWAWGYSLNGELGINNINYTSSPVQVPGTQWKSVSANYCTSYGTKSDGTLWVWGNSQAGQRGDNTGILLLISSPVQVPGTQWTYVNASNCSALALKEDNTLWTWGHNNLGQLATNDRVNRSSPTQLPGQWCFARFGGSFALGLKTNGTLWGWGTNIYGNLAQGFSTGCYSSPVQIPGTQWFYVEVGADNAYAKKTDNTAWVWGFGGQGRTGLNNASNQVSPVQLPGTQWKEFSDGYDHVIATKNDGTLWGFGANGFGQLGINNIVANISSPIQIPGTQWGDIGGEGYLASQATKTDGTLWTWGYDSFLAGIHGRSNAGECFSSPVQIPGTQWSGLHRGFTHTLAKKFN